MDLSMAYLYGDGFLIELMMWQDVLRKNWWWHVDGHSYGWGVTVGLATQLVQVIRACSVQRCVSIFWSIMAAVHTRAIHDEVDTIYCSKHVAWDGGASLPWWGAACGDCDKVVDDHGLRWFSDVWHTDGAYALVWIAWWQMVYRDKILSRTTMTSSGGGCKDLRSGSLSPYERWARSSCEMRSETTKRQVYTMLGDLRVWSHELGGLTLNSSEGNMLNESAWALGMGRLGDTTRHPPAYIGGVFVETRHHHSANMSLIRGVLRCVDEPTWRAKLGWKTRAGKSSEKLRRETRAGNSCRKLGWGRLGRTRAKSFKRNLGEVVGQKTRVRSFGWAKWGRRATRVKSFGWAGWGHWATLVKSVESWKCHSFPLHFHYHVHYITSISPPFHYYVTTFIPLSLSLSHICVFPNFINSQPF